MHVVNIETLNQIVIVVDLDGAVGWIGIDENVVLVLMFKNASSANVL